MSEEEIIKTIKKELSYFRCTLDDIKFKEAIQGLLNLYQQEKEKNKEKKIIADSFHEKMAKKFDEDFIKKSKIRELIERLRETRDTYKGYEKEGQWVRDNINFYNAEISLLEKLLK